MIKQTRESFKADLVYALECRDQYVSNEEIEKFLDLNFDEDSSIASWGYREMNEFVCEVCNEGFWDAVRGCDLNVPLKKYRVKLNGIHYCVEEEDVCDTISENNPNVDNCSDEWVELIDKEINRVKTSLPSTLVYDIDDAEDEDDAVDQAIDIATEKTGWLIEEVDSIITEEIKEENANAKEEK